MWSSKDPSIDSEEQYGMGYLLSIMFIGGSILEIF